MHLLFSIAYLICFALIAGGAFALMTQTLRRGETRGRRRHPEAPRPGERLLVVDLERERLEQLYRQPS